MFFARAPDVDGDIKGIDLIPGAEPEACGIFLRIGHHDLNGVRKGIFLSSCIAKLFIKFRLIKTKKAKAPDSFKLLQFCLSYTNIKKIIIDIPLG